MIFINKKMMFFLMKWHFLKYKYQQIALYFMKIIVNLKIFEVGVPVHHNLRVYGRSSLELKERKMGSNQTFESTLPVLLKNQLYPCFMCEMSKLSLVLYLCLIFCVHLSFLINIYTHTKSKTIYYILILRFERRYLLWFWPTYSGRGLYIENDFKYTVYTI